MEKKLNTNTKEVKEVKEEKIGLTTIKEYGKNVGNKTGRKVVRNFELPVLKTNYVIRMELEAKIKEAIIDRVTITLSDLQTRSKNGFGKATIVVEDKKVKISGLDTKEEAELRDKILMKFNNYGYENGYYYKYVRFYKPIA